MDQQGGWTAKQVELWLIAAFRALRGHITFSGQPDISPAGLISPSHREVLGWPKRFVVDDSDRDRLTEWAKCLARDDRFRSFVRDKGWTRATAERGRRRASEAIAAALNKGLDSETNGLGASQATEDDEVLAAL